MHSTVNGIRIFLSGESGDHHIGAHGNSDKQIEQKADQRTVAANCGHGGFPDETAKYSDTGGIKQLLEDAGQRQRNCHFQHLIAQCAVNHIHGFLFALFFHMTPFLNA